MADHAVTAWQATNGSLIHVGAGIAAALEAYLATNAERIVLVEPDPELAQALRERTHAHPRVEVIEAAVAQQGGSATLHRYTMQGQATLHPLTAPPPRWPGLKIASQATVTAQPLGELLESLNLADDKSHWLILDAPGELAPALKALAEHRPEQPVAYLSLIVDPLSLEAERDWPKLRKLMQQAGYRLEEITGQGDERAYHASADALWQANRQLTAELETTRKHIETLTEELAQQREAFNQAQEIHQQQAKVHAEELAKRDEEAKQHAKAHADELGKHEQAANKLAEQRDEAKQSVEKCKQKIERMTAELSEQREGAKQSEKAVKHEVYAQLGHLQKRNQNLQEENQRLAATQDKLKIEHERLEQQLKQLEELIEVS